VEENITERRDIHGERERIKNEIHRLHTDPLYGATGEYFFYAPSVVTRSPDRFVVVVSGREITLRVKRDRYDEMIQQVSREEFLK
jgi:hypothetical protein